MRILIVDDSALVRSIESEVLRGEADFTVIAEASNGQRAVELNRELEPDIVIMDINMPLMDGIEATAEMMRERPVPILILSSETDAGVSYRAISNGALEVIRKPDLVQFNDPSFSAGFFQKIRLLAGSCGSELRSQSEQRDRFPEARKKTFQTVVIGASTGGPIAVRNILTELPGTYPLGIAIVQHLEDKFDSGYAEWLDEACRLKVRLARDGDRPSRGEVLIAPADHHLVFEAGTLHLCRDAKVLNQRPSVDVLFKSAAREFGSAALAILLTGMGRDGAEGCTAVRERGGFTIVQDERSSTIFGMPKAAIEANAASVVLPLDEIAEYLLRITGV